MRYKILYIGLLGSLGALLRYVLSLIFISAIATTLCNMLGIVIIAKTSSLDGDKKDLFHTGFLGGFTSLSALMILKYSTLILIINIILGLIVYHFILKLQHSKNNIKKIHN